MGCSQEELRKLESAIDGQITRSIELARQAPFADDEELCREVLRMRKISYCEALTEAMSQEMGIYLWHLSQRRFAL